MASAPPPPPDGSAKGQEATAPPIMQQVSKFETCVAEINCRKFTLFYYSYWSSGSEYRTYFCYSFKSRHFGVYKLHYLGKERMLTMQKKILKRVV